ncbi:hypothetical protein SASPL_130588 [Salvia splendens]|uniref:Uncharacterized protein n=1 Tax=Salvia splendens TaxID=180675 RepID=A0A8X8ZJT4_SALSN|nr:hypothetical protein SASPL_130588 [Salvia splendens]
MANLYVRAAPTTDLNRNTEWFTYPGVWSTYILILFFSWLMVLSVFACSPGMAWTVVHLSHFLVCLLPPHAYVAILFFTRFIELCSDVDFLLEADVLIVCMKYLDGLLYQFLMGNVTYHFFHWKKGTPFAEDQGIYNRLTWWEQIDSGKQLTRNRKFLTVVPVVLRLALGLLTPTLDPTPLRDIFVLSLWRYLIASHTTDYQHPMLFFNTLAVFVLVVAKFPHMHKVRIFGINADQ